MKVIRQGTFETNSSSIHAICIAPDYTMPDIHLVTLKEGNFGWESNVYSNLQSRLNYLHEMMLSNENYDENKQRVIDVLKKHHITAKFEKNDDYYGIDHGYETIFLLNLLMSSEEMLLRYLFGDTYIITGNDNDDESIETIEETTKLFKNYDIFKKDN